MSHVPPYRRDVGMIFQNYALFPHMTAAENIAFPLEMRTGGRPEIKRRVARGARPGQARGPRRALSPPAVRRPAAADRARPGGRLPSAPAAHGRAARGARQEAPRGAPARGHAHQPPARRDRHLRDPRPGRGARHERPDRHLQQGPDRAAGPRRGPVRPAGLAVRGGLHRRVEHPARAVRARRRRRLAGPGRLRAGGWVPHRRSGRRSPAARAAALVVRPERLRIVGCGRRRGCRRPG